MAFTVCVCLIYLGYRGFYTLNFDSPFATTFSVTLFLAEIYGNMLMFLYFFQIWNPTVPDPVPPLKQAKVDAYIPTYNEEPELLRGTIVAALEMDYPHETYVLDDGNRPEVRELTEELGAKYISRDSNIHAKAGNLNHAMEITDGDFIIVFDSDHVAERHFITRTLGYFADDDLAFIQTPHSYYNFDSFQGSLNYDKRFYWEEGQLFYNIVQPGKNHWNAASFCGSAAIFRKSALESVGLIATESITEDMQTGLRLHSNGWNSLYINERLVSGLAAPDIETFSVQRLRWGEGNLGTIFYDNPITMKGLSFAQRLNYLALMLSWTTGVQKLILYYTPLLMLVTGVGPVADMTWHLVLITIFYVLTVWYTVKASGNGYGRLLDTEVTQMATFWTQCRGTYRALFNRKNSNFVVTQKSGGGRETSIHDFLRPQYTFIGCSIVAITWAASRYFLGVSEDFLGLSICSVLVLVHCVFAWIVIRRALAQRRFDWRHPCAAHVSYELETADGVQVGEGITKDLCETGVGFLTYDKLRDHDVKMTITAGDTSVTVNGKVCNWDSLVDYQSRKEGKVQCFRYGVQFVGLSKSQLRDLWHITTKYSVARRYVEFDPNIEAEVIDPVTTPKDHRLSVPVRMYRPDTGDLFSITETMTNNEFTLLSREDLRQQPFLRTHLTTPTGDITGNAQIIQGKPIDLGQMPLFAYRLRFDAFDGQSRGKLTTLMHLSHSPEMATVTTLRPKKTKMPIALPATIVGSIAVTAATITIIAALFFCHDQVLMARAAMKKPVDSRGHERLMRLVSEYERNPALNERHFLRLREAMIAIQDEDAISRLNETLITNEFETPAAKLQQAYTLEELGHIEAAREAFGNLIQNLDEFNSRHTRANVVLAAARNAVKREEFAEAEALYTEVWEEGTARANIRVEYAGILARMTKYELANEVLTADELTLDDLYLQASLFVGMQRFDRARRIFKTLALEYPDDIRAQKGVADIEAWTKNHEVAIKEYENILKKWPDDLETRIAMTQSLAWNKDRRRAIRMAVELLPQTSDAGRLDVWLAILESVSELDEVTDNDQVLVMKAFGERKNHTDNQYFLERLADCLLFAFEPDQAAPLVEQLVNMCPESKLLHTRYAQTLYEMGDFNEAAKHYEHLIVNDALPKDVKERGDVLLAAAFNSAQRGAAVEATSRYNMAMTCYMQLIQLDQLETTYWLPFLDAVSGSKKHTKEVSLTVLEIFNARSSISDNRTTLQRLADALSKVDEDRLAMQVLEELTTQEDDIDTRWRRANVLQRLAKYGDAERIYEDLIRNEAFATDESEHVQLLLAAANNSLRLERGNRARDRYSQALAILRARLKKRTNQTPLWLPFLSAISGMQGSTAEDMVLVMSIYRERERMAENFDFHDRLKDVLLIADAHDLTLPLFEMLLSQKPNSRRLQLQYAQALHTAGKHVEAETIFESLSQKRRTSGEESVEVRDYEISLSAANNALAQGKRRTATSLYRKTLDSIEPLLVRDISETQYWPPLLSALSGLNEVPSKHAKLVVEIYRNRDLYDEQATFVANLGHVMILMGDTRPAIDLLEQATLRFSNDKQLRVELARGYSAMGNYEKANAYYRWVVDRTSTKDNPVEESQLLMQAAQNSKNLGSKEDFEKYSNRALRLLSDQLRKDISVATLWQPFLDAAAGATGLAPLDRELVTALFKRWRTRSHDAIFLERLADVLVKSGDGRRAIILLEHQEADSPKTRLRLAMLLKDVGEYARAESRFRELLARKFFDKDLPTAVDLLLAAADNASKLQEAEVSQSRYGDALRLLRTSEDLTHNTQLAVRYLDAIGGAAEITEEDLTNVLDIRRQWTQNQDPAFRSRLVDVMLKLDRPLDALPILKTLVKEIPDSVVHQMRLARTLQSLNQSEEAGKIYDQLIDGGQITPNSSHYCELFAAAARNSLIRKQYDEARLRFETLFAQPIDRTEFDVEYALVLEQTGHREHAIRILEQKPQLSQDHQHLLASIYASAKEFTKAQATYQQLLAEYPTDPRAARGLADVAFWSEDFTLATQLYRRIIKHNPDDTLLLESLASALLWSGNRRAALAEFTTLLQSDPRRQTLWSPFLESATAASRLTPQQLRLIGQIENQIGSLAQSDLLEIRERLADVYATHGRHQQALTVLESLLVSKPNDHSLKAKCAMALIGLDRNEEALPILINLVNENPTSDELRRQLATAYVVSGDFERANAEMSLLITRAKQTETTEHARLLLGAASVSDRLDRNDEAKRRFTAALAILSNRVKDDETNVELWQPFLDAAAGANQFPSEVGQQAIRIFERRDQHDSTKLFLTRIADVMAIMDRPRDVLPILRRLIQRYPDDYEIEGRLANVYLTLRDFDHALPLLRRLAKRSEPAWKWRTQLANALFSSGSLEEAERIFTQLLASPDCPPDLRATLLLGAARNSVALKQFETAQRRFEERRDLIGNIDTLDEEYAGVLLALGEEQRVIELFSDRKRTVSLLRVLASAHESLGDRASARDMFAQILARAPGDDRAMQGLARIALADGEFQQAIELYEQLLQAHPSDEFLAFDCGIAYLSDKQFEKAATTFSGLLHSELDQDKVALAYLQAVAGLYRLTTDHIRETESVYQRLIGRIDVSLELITSLADVLLLAERPQEVLQLTEPYVLKPNQTDSVAQRRAHALLSTGGAREAAAIYRAWLDHEPNNTQARYLLALALHGSEQYSLADANFRNLLREKSNIRGEWYLAAADNADSLGQRERAMRLSTQAVDILTEQYSRVDFKPSSRVHLLRAINRSQDQSDHAELAVIDLYKLVVRDLEDPRVYPQGDLLVELARALVQFGRDDQANLILEHVAAKGFPDQRVAEKYAGLLMQINQYQRAITVYRHLQQSNPARSLFPMQLARANYNLGKYATAAEFFEQVMNQRIWREKIRKHHPDFLLSAADNSRRLGQIEKAETHYESAMNQLVSSLRRDFRSPAKWIDFLFAFQGIPQTTAAANTEAKSLVQRIFAKRHLFKYSQAAEVNSFSFALAGALERCEAIEDAKLLLAEIVESDETHVDARVQLARMHERQLQFEDAAQQYDLVLRQDLSNLPVESRVQIWLSAASTFAQIDRIHEASALSRRAIHSIREVLAVHIDQQTLWQPYLQAVDVLGEFPAIDARLISGIYATVQRKTSQASTPTFLIQLADALANTGKLTEAVTTLERVQEHPEIYFRFGVLLAKLGRYADAYEYFQKIESDKRLQKTDLPSDAFLLAIADTERRLGYTKRAYQHFETIANRYRTLVSAPGANPIQWRRYLQAIRGFEELPEQDTQLFRIAQADLERFSNDRDIIEALCDITLTVEDDTSIAVEFINHALQIFPDSIGVRFAKARGLFDVGSLSTAKEILTQLDHELAQANHLGKTNVEQEDRVLGHWLSAASQGEIKLLHGRVSAGLGDYETAVQLFESTPQVSTVDPIEYASILAKADQVDKAIQILVADGSEHPEAVAFLASLYIRMDRFAEARSTIAALLEKNPNDPDTLRLLANTLFWAREYEEAIGHYTSLLKQFPDDRELKVSMGKALLWVGRYKEASKILSRLVMDDITDTSLWSVTLDALAGSDTSALQNPAFQAIKQRYPQEPLVIQYQVSERLSRICRRVNEPMLARKHLLPYIDNANLPLAMEAEYADVLAALSIYDQAVTIYESVLERIAETEEQIDEHETRLRYADVLHQAKRYLDAQQHLDDVLTMIDDDNPARLGHALLSSARNLVALNQTQRALEHFERLQELDQDSFDLHEEYAGALLSASRPEEALQWLSQATKLSMEGEFLLGAVYTNLQAFRRAQHLYTDIVKQHPKQLRAWRLLADNASWAKDYRTAIHVYNQLLVRAPHNESLRIALASALLWSGDHQGSLDIYYEILQQSPDRYDLWANFVQAATAQGVQASPGITRILRSIVATRDQWPQAFHFRLSMVDALVRLGDDQSALQLMRELQKLKPKDRTVRRRLADEYHRLGRFDAAEEIYDSLLDGSNHGKARKAAPPHQTQPVSVGTPTDLVQ